MAVIDLRSQIQTPASIHHEAYRNLDALMDEAYSLFGSRISRMPLSWDCRELLEKALHHAVSLEHLDEPGFNPCIHAIATARCLLDDGVTEPNILAAALLHNALPYTNFYCNPALQPSCWESRARLRLQKYFSHDIAKLVLALSYMDIHHSDPDVHFVEIARRKLIHGGHPASLVALAAIENTLQLVDHRPEPHLLAWASQIVLPTVESLGENPSFPYSDLLRTKYLNVKEFLSSQSFECDWSSVNLPRLSALHAAVAQEWNAFNEILQRHGITDHEAVEKIAMAFDATRSAHHRQKRRSGEAYFNHLTAACIFAIEEGGLKDSDVIAAILLHDSAEDTVLYGDRREHGRTDGEVSPSRYREVAYYRLKKDYGRAVAKTVLAKTNPTKAEIAQRYRQGVEETLEEQEVLDILRRGGEPALIVYFADRWHNLSTLGAMPTESQIRKVRETERQLHFILDRRNRARRYRTIIRKLCSSLLRCLTDNQWKVWEPPA